MALGREPFVVFGLEPGLGVERRPSGESPASRDKAARKSPTALGVRGLRFRGPSEMTVTTTSGAHS